ncbi:MAG: hypothetical protein Q9168_003892 [Polycauliona sp. 1 TL-2023]
MADPLSFVASLSAVSSLAGNVATKGYHYIKIVKDCRADVRSLMAEVNVLSAILQKLVIFIRDTPDPTAVDHGLSYAGPDSGDEITAAATRCSDDESAAEVAPTVPLEPPEFINECRKTLLEIEAILDKFRRKASQETTSSAPPRDMLKKLQQMQPKELLWPLNKSRTFQLIGALERHKSTCTIALAKDGLIAIHTVLEQVRSTNKHLDNLRVRQEAIWELSLDDREERALTWLSMVLPASKLRNFSRERHRGTGVWLFDLVEFQGWLDVPKSALWIYGIPGAGKTILSTLVVEEVLSRIRSASVGTAYFYIRYDDKESHTTANVFGSLLTQLARQSRTVLVDVMELYKAQHSEGPPNDELLIEALSSASAHFSDTYLMIDGLDECGSQYNANRIRLIDALAALHQSPGSAIRTLIFSRDEPDIRKQLSLTQFQVVSIAATSADLRLFASAWLPSLEVGTSQLGVEIVDTLVDQAQGMLVKPLQEPAKKHRTSDEENVLHFSHFSIKEFLTMKLENVASPIARKYLVDPLDKNYLANFSLRYLMHEYFNEAVCYTWHDCKMFDSRQPLYGYIAHSVVDHIWLASPRDDIDQNNVDLRAFLSTPTCHAFKLWDTYVCWHQLSKRGRATPDFQLPQGVRDPLHFACMTGLVSQVKLLLAQGAKPNDTRTSTWKALSPLYLAIYSGIFQHETLLCIYPDPVVPGFTVFWDSLYLVTTEEVQWNLEITDLLVKSGAHVNLQHTFDYTVDEEFTRTRLTPLGIALQTTQFNIFSLLLTASADWNATSNVALQGLQDRCSVLWYLEEFPQMYGRVLRAAKEAGCQEMRVSLERMYGEDTHDPSDNTSKTHDNIAEELCIRACQIRNWAECQRLIAEFPNLDINHINDAGTGAIHWAAVIEDDGLVFVLEHAADPNLQREDLESALGLATSKGLLKNMKLLLDFGACIEHQNNKGQTPLLLAVSHNQIDAMWLLIRADANLYAVDNDGENALHLAFREQTSDIALPLLNLGVDPWVPDNFGTTPLHEACTGVCDYQLELRGILTSAGSSEELVNYHSPDIGSLLYATARCGAPAIVGTLLDAGASIDATGPGNLFGSALMGACSVGNVENVKILLERGAALEVPGSRFLSAVGTARAFRAMAVLEVLEDHTVQSVEDTRDEGRQPQGLSDTDQGFETLSIRLA